MFKSKDLKIGIAFPAFKTSFAHFLPNIEVVKDNPHNYDLIIFSGGEDISPSLYRQKETYASGVSPERDEIETDILRRIYSNVRGKDLSTGKLYILGVCRGHQLINALLGGGLIQDIFMEYKSSHPGRHTLSSKDPKLPVSAVSPTEMLSTFFNEKNKEYEVNSMHHQGVVYPGSSLIVTSLYGGVIESTENERIITVQWHPEFMDSYLFFEWLIDKIINKQKLFDKSKKGSSKDEELLRLKTNLDFNVWSSDIRPRIAYRQPQQADSIPDIEELLNDRDNSEIGNPND